MERISFPTVQINTLEYGVISVLKKLLFICFSLPFCISQASDVTAPQTPPQLGSFFVAPPNNGNAKHVTKISSWVNGRQSQLSLTSQGLEINSDDQNWALHFVTPQGKRQQAPKLTGQTEARLNLLVGPKSAWQQNLSTYKELSYGEIWSGISLRYEAKPSGLVAIFDVEPGANLDQLLFELRGTTQNYDDKGRLQMGHGPQALSFEQPYATQGSTYVPLSMVNQNGQLSYTAAPYSKTQRLQITQGIVWTAYTGGVGGDLSLSKMQIDSDGNMVIIGQTYNGMHPASVGAYDSTYNGNSDLIVTKWTSWGQLLSLSYLGGSEADTPIDLVIDHEGNMVIIGNTESTDFPVTQNAFMTSPQGDRDAFITKISADGSTLLASSFLGGSGSEFISDVAVDSENAIYAFGHTTSSNFPVSQNAYQTTLETYSLFLTKFSDDLQSMSYSTLFGPASPGRLEIDSQGNAYITGRGSTSMPTTESVMGPTYDTDGRAFLAKFNPTGTELLYSTYLGAGTYASTELIVEDDGSVLLGGYATDSGLDTHEGTYDDSYAANTDVFVAIVNPTATALEHATYYGGFSSDSFRDLKKDAQGNVIILLNTYSSTLPKSGRSLPPQMDIQLAKFDPTLSSLQGNIQFGQWGDENANSLVVHDDGRISFAGSIRGNDIWLMTGIQLQTDTTTLSGFVATFPNDLSSVMNSFGLAGQSLPGVADIEVDGNGNVYIAGKTSGLSYPTNDPIFSTDGYDSNYYVSKMSSDGSTLLFATIIGGNQIDDVKDIALGPDNSIYLTGCTESNDYPTSPGAYESEKAGISDAFITKLSPDGSAIEASSLLGGTSRDCAQGLYIAPDGEVTLVGDTASNDFPLAPIVPSKARHSKGFFKSIFLARFNADFSALERSTLYGGSGEEDFLDFEVDSNGRLVIAGTTTSTDLPITDNAFQSTPDDAFISRFDGNTHELSYGTFVRDGNPGSYDKADLELGQDDSIYFLSSTSSLNFQVTPDSYQSTNKRYIDLVLLKLDPLGQLDFGTYIGGNNHETVLGLHVDEQNNSHILGFSSGRFLDGKPEAPDVDANTRGYFYAVLNEAGNALLYAHQLTRAEGGDPLTMTADSNDDIYLAGESYYGDITTPGTYDVEHPATLNMFITKLSCTMAASVNLPASQIICPGEPITLTAEVMSVGAVTYQWYKDGEPVDGATETSLSIPVTAFADSGVYELDVIGNCSQQRSQPLHLKVGGYVNLTPRGQAWSLAGATFSATTDCDIAGAALNWQTTPEVPFKTDGNTITFSQAPPESLLIEVSYEDDTNVWALDTGALLVSPNVLFDDFNDDGCNDISDLHEAGTQWLNNFDNDPNGDGVLDIRDFLFIPIDPDNCPKP